MKQNFQISCIIRKVEKLIEVHESTLMSDSEIITIMIDFHLGVDYKSYFNLS
ncbi:TPA: hypothetical protein ACWX1I_001061 [Elizabethkingia anophelis]